MDTTSSVPAPRAEATKLGIDVHLDKYVVVRQIDVAAPHPAQSFAPR